MIYKKPGEKFSYEDITYTVGNRVLANEASEYSGLFGRILEIRTDDDRETENDTPDIYCEFDPPYLSASRRALEQTFSKLYGTPKRVEDLALDLVIMAPEMLTPLAVLEREYAQGTLLLSCRTGPLTENSALMRLHSLIQWMPSGNFMTI